jgi:hypothetical protein
MPPDNPLTSRSARPWYDTESGRAGAALSAVTIAVLAIGAAVIQGVRSDDAVESTPVKLSGSAAAIPAPAGAVNREEWIVLKGSAPAPTQLPAPKDDSERLSLPGVAERPDDTALDRL